MSRTRIPAALRRLVSDQARQRCGYCLTREAVVDSAMEVDHLIPEALGGATVESNLWLAGSRCNDHKNDRVASFDPVSEEIVPQFDPRRQDWKEHFAWSDGDARIEGVTPTGRATVLALDMNRHEIVVARRLWVSVGWHPPEEARA